MKVTLTVALIASLFVSAASAAQDWVHASANYSIVGTMETAQRNKAILMIDTCEGYELVYHADNLPEGAGNLTFVLRVDRQEPRTYTLPVERIGDMQGIRIPFDDSLLDEMRKGLDMRFKWSLKSGKFEYEEFSLRGFFKTAMEGHNACPDAYFNDTSI